jgi:hypothetical protein
LFSVRHSPLVLLLISCSVYDQALLDDAGKAENGGVLITGGSGSLATGGRTASSGNKATGSGAAGEGSVYPSAGSSSGSGGSGETFGGAGQSAVAGVAGVAAVAGSTANAGTGGGGAPNVPTGVDMIDDMENGTFYLLPKPPRFGYWYVAGDTTPGATLPKIEQLNSPLDPPRDASTRAMHFVASGFKGWGATVGLTFADATQKRMPYNAGNALGISFWVRGSVADNVKLRVLFPIVDTDPSGKNCGGATQGQCLDHFATQVAVTAQWQHLTVPFSSLHQAGWGVPIVGNFDPTQMLGIEWTAAATNIDVWIDDLALVRPQ